MRFYILYPVFGQIVQPRTSYLLGSMPIFTNSDEALFSRDNPAFTDIYLAKVRTVLEAHNQNLPEQARLPSDDAALHNAVQNALVYSAYLSEGLVKKLADGSYRLDERYNVEQFGIQRFDFTQEERQEQSLRIPDAKIGIGIGAHARLFQPVKEPFIPSPQNTFYQMILDLLSIQASTYQFENKQIAKEIEEFAASLENHLRQGINFGDFILILNNELRKIEAIADGSIRNAYAVLEAWIRKTFRRIETPHAVKESDINDQMHVDLMSISLMSHAFIDQQAAKELRSSISRLEMLLEHNGFKAKVFHDALRAEFIKLSAITDESVKGMYMVLEGWIEKTSKELGLETFIEVTPAAVAKKGR